MCLTDDQRHNHVAVQKFVKKVVELLQKRTEVTKLIQWSDNCASQYKLHKAFADISKAKIPTEHHYFGAQHGKGPVDAFIGIFHATIRGKLDIQKALDLYTYAKKQWTVEGKCEHAQTHFVHTELLKIRNSHTCETHTVPGTLKLHCVKATGEPYIVDIGEFSYFSRYKILPV